MSVSVKDHEYKYTNTSGKTAIFDIAKMTITTSDNTIHLSNCSSTDYICFESKEAKIAVPRHCENSDSFKKYISTGDELEFIGNEGLSGNIFKTFLRTDKFGYAYHFENGLVQLIIIPENVDTRITTDPSSISTYIYRISRLKGPFACKALG